MDSKRGFLVEKARRRQFSLGCMIRNILFYIMLQKNIKKILTSRYEVSNVHAFILV